MRSTEEASPVFDFAVSWRPSRIFVALALTFGLAFLIINPPFAVNDEDVHLARVYELASGQLFTRVDAEGEYHFVPKDYVELSAEYASIRYPRTEPRVEPEEVWEQLQEDADDEEVRFDARAAAYGPVCYASQLLVVGLLRHFDVSVLVHLYAARLAGLLEYVWLAWMAVIVSARLQWIFIAVALTPMALTQAAGVTADGTVIGLSLLFFALAAKAICTRDVLSRNEWLGMALAVILLTLCKPVYLLVALCLLGLFWTRPERRARNAAFLISVILLAIGLYALWTSMRPAHAGAGNPRFDAGRQLAFMAENPGQALAAAFRTLVWYGDNLLTQSIFVRARMSNLIRFSSAVAVVLHLQLVLGLATGSLVRDFPGSPRTRRMAALWFGLTAVLIVVVVSAAIYVCCTAVGANRTQLLHGRYFIPAVAPLLLACGLLGRPLFSRWLRAGHGGRALALIGFNNGLCLFTLIGFHYFPARIEWPL
jgi:uncharacterized membrane protein